MPEQTTVGRAPFCWSAAALLTGSPRPSWPCKPVHASRKQTQPGWAAQPAGTVAPRTEPIADSCRRRSRTGIRIIPLSILAGVGSVVTPIGWDRFLPRTAPGGRVPAGWLNQAGSAKVGDNRGWRMGRETTGLVFAARGFRRPNSMLPAGHLRWCVGPGCSTPWTRGRGAHLTLVMGWPARARPPCSLTGWTLTRSDRPPAQSQSCRRRWGPVCGAGRLGLPLVNSSGGGCDARRASRCRARGDRPYPAPGTAPVWRPSERGGQVGRATQMSWPLLAQAWGRWRVPCGCHTGCRVGVRRVRMGAPLASHPGLGRFPVGSRRGDSQMMPMEVARLIAAVREETPSFM